jgi:ABC-type multidrug transport system fused ATPase/permease subunit
MWRALETCHLADKIRTLDGGLSHEVAEAGSNFSIGESQLMCLSRAVLRKTKVPGRSMFEKPG